MGYALGIDLGTTYTAAAVARDDRVEMVGLGNRGAPIPSVVFIKEEAEVLIGEAANRRAMAEPERVSREFKRRLGDPAPILLGGTPYASEALMAKLLRHVVDIATASEGAPPDQIALCHPANWGDFKLELLRQAVRRAGLPEAVYVTEPEAAAIQYASLERLNPGDVVLVYDLGGGTFDAAVLSKTDTEGFEVLGQPEGIERLGGIDFDEAVFGFVRTQLADEFAALDLADPDTITDLQRLRQDCVEAKEALSSDTETSIAVSVPGIRTEVRLSRTEFESMIRPTIVETIEALHRALASAGLDPSGIARVLLVGGSSRIPLVAEMVGSAMGRPVAVDAHPKHTVASGAARFAALSEASPAATTALIPPADPAPTPPVEPATTEPTAEPLVADSPVTAAIPDPLPTAPAHSEPVPTETVVLPPPVAPITPSAADPMASDDGADGSATGAKSKVPILVGVAVVVIVAVIAGAVLLGGGGGGGGDDTADPGTGAGDGAAALDCPDEDIPSVCITDVDNNGGAITASFRVQGGVQLRQSTSAPHAAFFFKNNPAVSQIWGSESPFSWEGNVSVDSGIELCSVVVDASGQVSGGSQSCADVPAG